MEEVVASDWLAAGGTPAAHEGVSGDGVFAVGGHILVRAAVSSRHAQMHAVQTRSGWVLSSTFGAPTANRCRRKPAAEGRAVCEIKVACPVGGLGQVVPESQLRGEMIVGNLPQAASRQWRLTGLRLLRVQELREADAVSLGVQMLAGGWYAVPLEHLDASRRVHASARRAVLYWLEYQLCAPPNPLEWVWRIDATAMAAA